MIWVFIFLLGLIGVGVILTREVLAIEKEGGEIEHTAGKMLLPRDRITEATKEGLFSLQLILHRAVIAILRSWVIFTHKVNKWIRDKIASRPEGGGGAVSNFLSTVSEYKEKMRKMRERLERKEDMPE